MFRTKTSRERLAVAFVVGFMVTLPLLGTLAAISAEPDLGSVASKLAELGYITIGDDHATDEGVVVDASRAFLDFHGLHPKADPVTDVAEHLARDLPRCGLPDFEPMRAEARQCQWPHKDIRFWQDIRLPGLTPAVVAECYRKAVESWEAACDIAPVLVADQARANIRAVAGKIDRPGAVLAWSHLPCGVGPDAQMQQVYDTSESWGPVLLQEVMAHEIGHALGLSHSRAGNLMQPYATGRIVVPQAGDIAEVVSRYGKPKPRPDPVPPTAPPVPPTAPPLPPVNPPVPPTNPPTNPPTDRVEGEIRINGRPFRLVPSGEGPPPIAPAPSEPRPGPEPRPTVGERLAELGLTWERVLAAVAAVAASYFGWKARAKTKAKDPQ